MESARALDQQPFRDKLANLDKKGKRLWIFPKKPLEWKTPSLL